MNIKIIDNFLNEDDFKELCSLNLKKMENDKIIVHHNQIDKNGNVKCGCLSDKTIRRLFKNYHNKAINLLRELNPQKVDLYEYSIFEIIETGSNYKFPIHNDTPDKLLSGVIYLKPEKNTGTIFYNNKKGDGRKEIDWKQNKGVFFSRIESKSWHSYQGDGKSNRVALVYNLMTTNIKKVCKIEKTSYLLSMLRFLINPYLFRYFKFTI